MSSPSSWIWDNPITPATIASAVTGERHEPYGPICGLAIGMSVRPPPCPPPYAGEGKLWGLMRYFEDFHVGEIIDLGSVQVNQADIIGFAQQYDPQPMHVNPDAASFTIYGGLIASGWHTGALFMSLLVRNLIAQTSSLGSPGMEELNWPAPVRPADTLTGQIEVLAIRLSNSRPMGIVRWRGHLRNQHDQLVMTAIGTNFFGLKPA